MGLLTGKVAIITGAGGGLGEAYARLFARGGRGYGRQWRCHARLWGFTAGSRR